MKRIGTVLLTGLIFSMSLFCVTSCGKKDGLQYKRSKDRSYYIVTGIGDENLETLEIPATYKGLPVKEVGEKAFDFCKNLKKVALPDSITKIGDSAFMQCNHLWEIDIPYGMMSIGDNAFESCYNLQEISLPNSVVHIGEGAFGGCWSIKEFVFPDSVTSIEASVLSGCRGLTKVTIGKGVKSIGEKAFVGCPELNEIFIPANVTRFEPYAFNGFFERIILENTEGWTARMSAPYDETPVAISSEDLQDLETAKKYLANRYSQYIWICEE